MVSYEGTNLGKIFLPGFVPETDALLFGDMLIISNSEPVLKDIRSGVIHFFATNPPERPSLILYKFVPYKF
jgi:hypothetical protein